MCFPCHLFSLVCLIRLHFSGSSLGILLGDALLSAHYQPLKNFQFSAHSVLVKIEYISLPLYHVENLWFMVCWNSSCYIQNASPGSSHNAQGLSALHSQCFGFNSFSTLFSWIFCFNLLFSFPLAKFFVWKVIFFQVIFCVIQYGRVSRCSSALASSY